MIRSITFDVKLFNSPADLKRSRKALLWLLEGLTQVNLGWLQLHQTLPLYKTTVIYVPEHDGEVWKDVPSITRDGFGDCEDLACWRAAELRLIGVMARPYLKWKAKGATSRYHAVVQLPNGKIEDPSRALGMRGLPIVRKPVYIEP